LPVLPGIHVERLKINLVRVVGDVRVVVLAVRFIGAILDVFRGRGYLLLAAISGDEGQDGVLGSANRDAGCFVEEDDGAVNQIGSVDAEAAAEERDEYG